MQPPTPADESERLRSLQGYNILDTLPEQAYDDITHLASQICGTPTALVSFVDEHRQWFKSARNFDHAETPRDTAFCAHAIVEEDLFVVPDTLDDARFADNALVRGGIAVRFYAGAPLVTPEGHAIGTLCVMDQRPRELTPEQRASLRALARQVMAQLELRRHAQDLQRRVERNVRFQEALRDLAKLKGGDLDDALRRVTQADAEALEVTRVSVWMFDDTRTRLTCPVLFHREEGFQKIDAVLEAERCPRYFRAMEESRRLAAVDAETDPRTSEFTDWYLRPLGIISMLDVPIWLDGKMVGLVCHESVGRQREWTDDEQDFAASIADMASFAMEASERQAAEDALGQSEARLRTVFEQFPLCMHVLSPDGKTQQVNEAWQALFGRTADFNPLNDPHFADVAAYLLRGHGETVALPATLYQRRRPDGTPSPDPADGRWVQAILCPVREKDGRLLEVLTVLQDVTERRRAEDSLRESEEKFKHFFEASGDPVMLADRDRVVDCNQACVELLGYANRAQVVSLHPWNFSPEFQDDGRPSLDKAREMIAAAYDTGYHRFEWTHKRADGTTFPAEISLTLMDIQGEQVMFTNLRDITERRRAETDLRAAYSELENAREGLEHAVSERTAQLTDTNAALRTAHAEAERANLAKSEFLSRMSHELRTPMNSILGFAQVLARKIAEPGQRKNVDHILRAGKHLLELINEVLDISRIEANRMQLSPEPVHLGRVVGEALAMVAPLAAQRNCELINDLSDCTHYVLADSQRLTQVLLNLLSNAVKYNRDGGTVTLACERHGGDRMRLRVRDTGRGISAASMERLFNPFDRLGAESYGVEGTGLGLVLSKRLVEVMGGTLLVKSEEGKGSTFTVELACADDPQERLVRGRDKEAAPAPAPARTSTVLYIEDNVANLSLIETIFAERPAIVLRSALQGRLGLELAFEHRPDLILLDLHLPDISGEAVLHELQRDARTREIPVVIISADATTGQPERLRKAGASAYLTKPLDVDSLLTTVDGALEKSATRLVDPR